jgi:hypothetical protein
MSKDDGYQFYAKKKLVVVHWQVMIFSNSSLASFFSRISAMGSSIFRMCREHCVDFSLNDLCNCWMYLLVQINDQVVPGRLFFLHAC